MGKGETAGKGVAIVSIGDVDNRIAAAIKGLLTKEEFEGLKLVVVTEDKLKLVMGNLITAADLEEKMKGFVSAEGLDERLKGLLSGAELDERLKGLLPREEFARFAEAEFPPGPAGILETTADEPTVPLDPKWLKGQMFRTSKTVKEEGVTQHRPVERPLQASDVLSWKIGEASVTLVTADGRKLTVTR